MKRIKVLMVIRQGEIGGGETHVLDLVQHINKDEFKPKVLTFTDGPMISRLQEMDVDSKVIKTKRGFDLRVWGAISRFLKDEKFDIVHAHGSRAASNVLHICRRLKIPIIYTVHGWSFHEDQKWILKNTRIKAENYISNRTNLNISVSLANQNSGRDNFNDYNSTLVNYGINTKKFNPNVQYENLRDELGISSDKVLISSIIRMTKQKDPITLILAFDIALKNLSNIHLLLVGDGELKEECINLVDRLGINDNVTFEKFRTDIPKILAGSDIYCLSSLWEGLPIGLLEAMSMGKAVIATAVDGSKEAIKDNINGFLVEPEQPQILAEQMVYVSESQTRRGDAGEEAIKTIHERYNIERMTLEIEQIYYKILK